MEPEARTITLTHFSEKPLLFKPHLKYGELPGQFKPAGLWLSDETESGWAEWCKGSQFRLEMLTHRTEFECDTSNWKVIRNQMELIAFDREFRTAPFPGMPRYYVIDWEAVQGKYSGILITPYQWKLRLKLSWYYSWDCASACVWDLSTIRPTEEILVSNPMENLAAKA